MVMVIVVLGEELLALLTLLVTSLLGTPVLATEMFVSLKPSRTNPVSRIPSMTRIVSFFTSTPLVLLYSRHSQIQDIQNGLEVIKFAS